MISLFLKKLSLRRVPERQWNRIVDQIVEILPTKELPMHFTAIETTLLDLSLDQFRAWLKRSGLKRLKRKEYAHKKALEFFFSFQLLGIKEGECILDAAGGDMTYLRALKNTAPRHRQILADHIYSGKRAKKDGTILLGGDISSLQLPNGSIDKITCHHAFEHFQADKDVAFIKEVGRLLSTGGKGCIIPIFLARSYLECRNIPAKSTYDPLASLVIDESSSLPGADEEGHFARIYDPGSFKKRVLQTADVSGLKARIVTLQIDGADIPDMNKNFGSRINNPMRALVLERARS